jgi:hypothetical protein
MEHSAVTAPQGQSLEEAVNGIAATARDQLAAAWQLHVERVEEELRKGWLDHIGRVVDERFGELSRRAEQEIAQRVAERVDSQLEAARLKARQELSEHLNQFARRLRQTESEEGWAAALAEAAGAFCARTAVFQVKGTSLHWGGVVEVPLATAPAFQTALETLDTVITMRTANELSNAVTSVFPEAAGQRSYLFPVIAAGRAAAVLYAEPGDNGVNMHALELLASLAGGAMPKPLAAAAAAATTLVKIEADPRQNSRVSNWDVLTRAEQDLHLRAQRFARVRVAEMRLYHSQAVKSGRAESNLYQALKTEIDAGREGFRSQYMEQNPSMVDYLHQEIVRTLANDDANLLGPEYPGPLA